MILIPLQREGEELNSICREDRGPASHRDSASTFSFPPLHIPLGHHLATKHTPSSPFLSIYEVPSLFGACLLYCSILCEVKYHYPHFTDGETESEKVTNLSRTTQLLLSEREDMKPRLSFPVKLSKPSREAEGRSWWDGPSSITCLRVQNKGFAASGHGHAACSVLQAESRGSRQETLQTQPQKQAEPLSTGLFLQASLFHWKNNLPAWGLGASWATF